MRTLIAALLPLLLLGACRRPEVAAFGREPQPVAVRFWMPLGQPRSEAIGKEYAAVLRARLASCVQVVPEGREDAETAATLDVTITELRSPGAPSPGAIGVAAGMAVGALSALAGNRDAFLDGLFWGFFIGSSAADARDDDRYHLGYVPMRVSARVKLRRAGEQRSLLAFSVEGREVIDQMGPLSWEARHDDARIREEEAKAFAKVVVARLQEQFHWLPRAESDKLAPADPILQPEP